MGEREEGWEEGGGRTLGSAKEQRQKHGAKSDWQNEHMCMRHRGGGRGEFGVRQWGLSSHLTLPTKAFLFHLFPRNSISCPIGSPKKQVNGKMLPVPKICNTLKPPSEALSAYNHLKWLVINQMTLYLPVSLAWSHTVVGFALKFYHKILCLIKHRVLEIYRGSGMHTVERYCAFRDQVAWSEWPRVEKEYRRVRVHALRFTEGGGQGFSNNAVRTHSTPAFPHSPPSLFPFTPSAFPFQIKLCQGSCFLFNHFHSTTNSIEKKALGKWAHIFIKGTL